MEQLPSTKATGKVAKKGRSADKEGIYTARLANTPESLKISANIPSLKYSCKNDHFPRSITFSPSKIFANHTGKLPR